LVRDRWPGKRVFTYWDYRAGMFHQDLGMRIDLVLATGPLAERVRAAWVDWHARKGSGPSDHAPVIVDLDEAPDGDIGPVVPPPSAPATPEGDPAAVPQTLRVPLRKWSQTTGLNPPRLGAVACDLSGEESFSIFAY
jgi:exodeoxyribonuclease III